MNDLERVKALCDLMLAQAASVEVAKETLRAAQEALNRTQLEDLPDLMIEVGIVSLTLDDGATVALKAEVSAAITAANKPAALAWLADHGFGGIIKTKVGVEFGRAEHDAALECAEALAEEYPGAVALDESVHPSTLKSFVKEQLEQGVAIPMDLFSIHPYHKAELKRK